MEQDVGESSSQPYFESPFSNDTTDRVTQQRMVLCEKLLNSFHKDHEETAALFHEESEHGGQNYSGASSFRQALLFYFQ